MYLVVLLNKQSNPVEDVFDFCTLAADRTLPYSDSRHVSNLVYAYYALIGNDFELGNQTLLGNIGDSSVGFIQEFNAKDILLAITLSN
jgi:hypothetical protein